MCRPRRSSTAPLLASLFILVSMPLQAADCAVGIELLRLGDSEKQILRIMGETPVKTSRSETAGVTQSSFVFQSGGNTCTLTLVFDCLVSKRIDQQRTGLFGF